MRFSLTQWLSPAPPLALVIRASSVELLSLAGETLASRVRVPIAGGEDAHLHLVEAIRTALEEAGLRQATRVAVCLPTHDALVRFFTMPVIPKSEWETAVQFEARKYIPFKIDGLIWDYKVLPATSAQQLEVVFAAVPRDAFTRVQRALADLGLQATLIEPRSLSLARLVSGSRDANGTQAFTCLVDVDPTTGAGGGVEAETAHLAIVKDGLPYLAREIGMMSAKAPHAAAGAAQPSASGVPAGTGPEPIDQPAQRLLSELSLSMDFFKREHPASSVGCVYLFGEESRIGPWCRGLSEQLRCPVELGSRFLDQRVYGNVPLAMGAAVGLLLATRRASSVALDFMKRSQAKAPSLIGQLRAPAAHNALATVASPQAAALMIPAVLLLAAMWFAGTQQVALERRRLEAMVGAAPSLGDGLKAVSPAELQVLQEQASTVLSVLTQTIDARLRLVEKLDALARSVPDGVWFTRLAFSQASRVGVAAPAAFRLEVAGACFLPQRSHEEQGTILKFQEQLKANPAFFKGFTNARLDTIGEREHAVNTQRYTYRTFELRCDSERSL